jgi:LmeA-like phospholipid-binding
MTWNAPTQSWDTPAAPPPRRHRGLRNTIIVVLALIVLFVVGDRLAVLYAQSQVAQQFKEQGGFEGTPSVSIKGFPFLTQVIAHNIHEITITSDKIKAGPVTITNLDADITDVKLNGPFTAGTIGHLDGKALIPFSGLTNALGGSLGGGGLGDLGDLASGVTIKAAGGNTIKASFDLLVISGSATLKVTREPGNKIHIQLLSSHGLPSEITDQLKNLTVPIPALPLGMKIQRIQVNADGISIHVTGDNVKFSN